MFITKKHLDRRTFLRGAVGTAIALPLLDAMVPAATAQTLTAAQQRFRFGAIYMPNGVYPGTWHPTKAGKDFEFNRTMKPLEPYRDYVTTVSRLKAPDGKKDMGGIHMGASAAFLNGGRVGTSRFSHAATVSSSGNSGEGADATRAQALVDPGGLSPARAVGASRVPQPHRYGASVCSAEGRSATRSDPQHPRWRTQWPGQAVGGSKPELPFALPSDASVNRRQREEERWTQVPGSG
jgi:hypothetical protein